MFSQYGEILDINLIRDKKTGKSKGFAFLRYEDQRSTILAVDNLTGSTVLGRKLRVDHVNEYKQPKKEGENAEDWDQDPRASMNVAPVALLTPEQRAHSGPESHDGQKHKDEHGMEQEDYTRGIDPEDPMFDYLVNERREAALAKASKKSHRSGTLEDKERRHRSRKARSRSPGSHDRHDRRTRPSKDSERSHRRRRSRSRS